MVYKYSIRVNFWELKAVRAINRFAESAIRPKVVSKHPVSILELANDWFDDAPAEKECPGWAFFVFSLRAIVWFGGVAVGMRDRAFVSVVVVAGCYARPFADETLDLAEGIVIEEVVRNGRWAKDGAAGLGCGYRCLDGELIFLVSLALTDAGCVWLMNAENLACVVTLLALSTFVSVKRLRMSFKRFR